MAYSAILIPFFLADGNKNGFTVMQTFHIFSFILLFAVNSWLQKRKI